MARFTSTLATVLFAVSFLAGHSVHAAPVMTHETTTISKPHTNMTMGASTNNTMPTGNTNSTSTTEPTTVPVASTADSLQCNIARATLITDLNEIGPLLQVIDTSDPNVSSAVAQAQTGLGRSIVAFTGVLKSVLGVPGQQSAEDGLQKTGEGLGLMISAFDGLNSTDPAITTAVNKINDATAAGLEIDTVCR